MTRQSNTPPRRSVPGDRDALAGTRLACLLMSDRYVAPALHIDAFNCPECGAFAHQEWLEGRAQVGSNGPRRNMNPEVDVSICAHCHTTALWIEDRLIHPRSLTAPPAHPDLPDDARKTYEEARAVLPDSVRASGALLRLCLQQLVADVGATSSDLNTAVGELVRMGLPPRVQQAMDAVRFIGNEAAHPGQIQLDDEPQTVMAMFDLVGFVVDTMITQPRQVEEMYSRLPASKLKQIERRDAAQERSAAE